MRDGDGFRPDAGRKYEMPIVFGPSEIPDVSSWESVEMVSLSFRTTHEAARPLVPAAFQLPDEPIVTVSRMTYGGVDYLAGRGYNELTVGISATAQVGGAAQRAPYMPVVWVDEIRPILIGREFLGYAKLGAELPPVEHDDRGARFEIAEYGSVLVRGSVSELTPLDPERLDTMRRAAATTTVFGWKYVAGIDGRPDADYPTQIDLEFSWNEASAGQAAIDFASPSWAEAPNSARIVNVLAGLPVTAVRPGVVARGSGSINRNAARRLDLMASA